MTDKATLLSTPVSSVGTLLNFNTWRRRTTPFLYRLFGMGLNMASLVNNEWAAKLLANLWFTVFKREVKPRVKKFWQQADRCIELKLENKSIPVYLWGQDSPQVPLLVMMHGWSGSGSQFQYLIPGLLKAGYRVAVFDAPAHGSNAGKHSHLGEFCESLLAIQQQVGAIDTMIAHSLGSMATLMATQQGLNIRQMVLFAPYLDAEEMVNSFTGRLNLNRKLSSRLRNIIKGKMANILDVDNCWKYLSPGNLLANSDYRGLLIYDLDDEEVPLEQFLSVARCWQNCRIIKTRKLGHNRILKDKKVIERVLAYMKPAKPGADRSEKAEKL